MVYLLFVLGFIFLIKGADMLVDGASALAKKFSISNLVIGLTIVSFGTSLPELIVNLVASFQGSSGIAIGNILGSNIANILLVLGVAATIYPLSVHTNTVRKEIPFSGFVIVLMAALVNLHAWRDSDDLGLGLGLVEGIVLLVFFALFMMYITRLVKSDEGEPEQEIKEYTTPKALALIVIGIVGVAFGGQWVVDGAIYIAQMFHMDETVIGLTIVAVGTSLPELATSAVAAYRRNVDIAVGNVVGSNIFNVLWVLGVSAVIKPLPFEAANYFEIGAALFASVLLFAFVFLFRKHTVSRWNGAVFVLLYIGFVIHLVLDRQ